MRAADDVPGAIADLVARRLVSRRVAITIVIVLVATVDQVSKSIVLATHAGLSANPGSAWFTIRLARNHGVSNGIGAGQPLLVTVVEVLGTAFIAALAFRMRNRVAAYALAVVVGGAVGNAADRFVRSPGLGRGAVVDWIHFGSRGGSLDLADLAIQSGAVVALVATVLAGRGDRPES